MRPYQPSALNPGTVIAPSEIDFWSSNSSARSRSVTLPMPSHRGHMPPVTLKLRFTVLRLPRWTVIAPTAADRRDVEGVRLRRSDVRLTEPAEDDPQHRVRIGDGADGGARVRSHPLLVDDDRRGQPLQHVDLRPRLRGHEALHEGAVGLVDEPLRLGGDGAEHERALARAGDTREHRQPALRDLDADVVEVVHARAAHADQVVAVRARRAGGVTAHPPDRARSRLADAAREGDRARRAAVLRAVVGLGGDGDRRALADRILQLRARCPSRPA